MSFLTGKSKSSSSNQAYPFLQGQFGGTTGFAQQGGDLISALLGGDSSAFNRFSDSAGMNSVIDAGSRAITGNKAANGLLRSGSTGTALTRFGQDTAKSYLNQYMQQALGLSNIGLGAGGVLANAGQTSTSKLKPGLGGLLGGVASGIAASERRLKKNIVKVGELPYGLGVYDFQYKSGGPKQRGVMVDEIELIRPESLGPVINGIRTVDYSKGGLTKDIRELNL